jgi:hypothetical protein
MAKPRILYVEAQWGRCTECGAGYAVNKRWTNHFQCSLPCAAEYKAKNPT